MLEECAFGRDLGDVKEARGSEMAEMVRESSVAPTLLDLGESESRD